MRVVQRTESSLVECFFLLFFFFFFYKYNEKTKANYYIMGIKICVLVNFTSYQTSKRLNNGMYNENIDT
jgi:hypothetical protein